MELIRKDFQYIDSQILLLLGQRKNLSIQIAKLKNENNLPIIQEEIWNLNLTNRLEENKKIGLDEEFITKLFNAIHDESIRIQQSEIL